jgi:hypothetical protein
VSAHAVGPALPVLYSGVVALWPQLRRAPDDIRHLDVQLTVAAAGIALSWGVDVGEPLFVPPPDGA